MKHFKNLIYVLGLLPFLFCSCNKTEEPNNPNDDAILIVDSKGIPINKSISHTTPFSIKDVLYDNSVKPITLYGYTSKELVESGKKLMFTTTPEDNRLDANVIYLYDTYCYKYQITIEHDASLVIPNSYKDTWATGFKIGTTNEIGYDKVLISKSAQGDIYELRTCIIEVSHNASGQYLGFTAYLPFRVGNPSTDLKFQYYVETVEWVR